MAFTTTSKYVQLTPYLLMEYMYADQPTPETHFTNTGSTKVGFDKLVNGYMDNAVQIFNPDVNYSITQNTVIDSVVRVAENSFVSLSSNFIIPFNDYSEKLTSSVDLPITFPYNLSVVYDTVRYHIRAGYNLQNIDGIILGIDFQDSNSKYVTVSQIILKKGTEQKYTLNPSPVTIGANIYDKYFEIKIPSLKDMNDKYIATPPNYQPDSLGGLLSASGYGFYYGAPMRVSVWQIQSTGDYDGYPRYDTARIGLLSLEEEDPFGNIGAYIQESDKGQFFEYFATDNEGFIEDFILFQNSLGNSYYINHKIEVLEQIGAAIIETSQFQSVQTTAYDTPNYYRPIVRNAAYSSSFFLRYTMSLINSKDQSSVIRIATYSSNSPAKWGMNIAPIQLSDFPQVQKIYNRVYSQPQIKLGGFVSPTPKTIYKFTNVFIQQYNVTATLKNLSMQTGTLTENSGQAQTTAFGSGNLTINISPFDNYYKFQFLKAGTEGNPVAIDLSSSGNYNMVFVDQQGKKTYVPALLDNTIARPSGGELAFKVDESVSSKVLAFTDRRFFIVNGGNLTPGATGSNLSGVAQGATTISGNDQRSADMLSTFIKTTDTAAASVTSTASLPASVMYWGYWKKEGEVEIVAPVAATGPATPVGTTGATSAPEPIEIIAPKPIIKGVKPIIVGPTASTRPRFNPRTSVLTGSAMISALAAQIRGLKDQGWSDANIRNYFLLPGRPGYLQYPGLTAAEFALAARGILTAHGVFGFFGVNNYGSGCPTPDMNILLGDNNWIKAGDITVGTEIYTTHEKTGEWGLYKISHAEKMLQQVLSVKIGDKTVTVSDSHKFLTSNNEYISISDLEIGSEIKTLDGLAQLLSKESIGRKDVIKLEVEDAHTYILEGIISHNKLLFNNR